MRPDKISGFIWIQIVCYSDGIPKRFLFENFNFEEISRQQNISQNYPPCNTWWETRRKIWKLPSWQQPCPNYMIICYTSLTMWSASESVVIISSFSCLFLILGLLFSEDSPMESYPTSSGLILSRICSSSFPSNHGNVSSTQSVGSSHWALRPYTYNDLQSNGTISFFYFNKLNMRSSFNVSWFFLQGLNISSYNFKDIHKIIASLGFL